MSSQVSRRGVLGAGLPWALVLAGCTQPTDRGRTSAPTSRSGKAGSGPASGTTADRSLVDRRGATQIRVAGSAPVSRRRHYLADAVGAVAPVERVWGHDAMPERVDLSVPATATEFVELTGVTDGDVPAVTRADGRVVIHPDLWDRTSAAGRQVVLTHELTHVALGQGGWTHAARWVVEGPAEVTAYRSRDLPPERVAPGVAQRVRAGRGPTGPPSEQEMAGPDGYGLAWAWCSYLVARDGQASFVRFVRRVGRRPTAAGTRSAFRQTYGTTPSLVAAGYPTWLASWV